MIGLKSDYLGTKMETYFFTFGFGQAHPNKYVKIEAEDYCQARDIMVDRFGLAWAFQYDEAEFAGQAEEYGLTELQEE
jgi:hypothetical protein